MATRASDFTIELGPGLRISARKLWVENMLIVANSGGGKSVAGRQLIEQCAPHCAMVVFDYKGEYWSLREAFDVIIVGRKGELPIDVAIAPKLASFVRESGCRVVVNLSGVDEDTKAAFVAAFADALLSLPEDMWRMPLLVYVSEAQMLAPEQGRPVSRKAIRDLGTLGRQMRICTVLDTQRLAELAKAALGSVNNRMFGRQNSDVDLARATAALGLSGRNAKKAASEMKQFDPGTFACEGAAFLFGDEAVETSGMTCARTNPKTKTRHIDPAEDFDLVPPPPSANVRALVQALGRQAQAARAEPIVDRDSKPSKRAAASVSSPAGEDRYQQGYDKGLVDGRMEAYAAVRRLGADFIAELGEAFKRKLGVITGELPSLLNATLLDFNAAIHGLRGPEEPDRLTHAPVRRGAARTPVEYDGVVASTVAPVRARPQPRGAPKTETADGLGDSQRDKYLRVIISAGGPISRRRAAMMAGIGTRSSSLRDVTSMLKRDGMVETSPSEIWATEAAKTRYPNVAPPMWGEELIEHWLRFFKLAAARDLLEVLINAKRHGEGPLSREEAAHRANISIRSSNWRDGMSLLRRAKIMNPGEELELTVDFWAAISSGPPKKRKRAA